MAMMRRRKPPVNAEVWRRKAKNIHSKREKERPRSQTRLYKNQSHTDKTLSDTSKPLKEVWVKIAGEKSPRGSGWESYRESTFRSSNCPREVHLCISTYRCSTYCTVCLCLCWYFHCTSPMASIQLASLLSLHSSLQSSLALPSLSPVSSVQCFTQQPQASLTVVPSSNGALRERERVRERQDERKKEGHIE